MTATARRAVASSPTNRCRFTAAVMIAANGLRNSWPTIASGSSFCGLCTACVRVTDDYDRIVPPLRGGPLHLKQMLHQPGTPIRYVYFPRGGFCSELIVLGDGRMVEV